MKRQLTVALGLAVLATPALATKARLQALGEDSYGSAYINDNRNIWLNAAQINNHKDLVTYELGGNQSTDSASTARGEGGVYKTMGNMVYGLHLGGASNTANAFRTAAGANGADENNNIDVFVGGDAGLKWGANLGYAKTSDESGPLTAESMRSRVGVIMGDTQAYGNVSIINDAKGTNGVKFDGKLGYQLGVIHAWEGYSLFADFQKFDGESIAVGGAKSDLMVKRIQVGAGRVTRLNDKTNLFTKASLVQADAENDTAVGSTFSATCSGTSALGCEEYKTLQLPIVVGLEAEANSWLTLRASVSQVVWGTEEDKNNERSIANSTSVAAGATLKFGELSVDGVIGNNDGTSTAAGIGEDTSSGNGTLRTDNLMTRVSMTYRF
jgi:hypothetical protein